MPHNQPKKSSAPPISFILSVLFQLMLAPISFLLVIFSAAGLANSDTLTKLQSLVLDTSLLALPAIPLLTALILAILRATQSKHYHLAWNLISIVSITIYVIYALSFTP